MRERGLLLAWAVRRRELEATKIPAQVARRRLRQVTTPRCHTPRGGASCISCQRPREHEPERNGTERNGTERHLTSRGWVLRENVTTSWGGGNPHSLSGILGYSPNSWLSSRHVRPRNHGTSGGRCGAWCEHVETISLAKRHRRGCWDEGPVGDEDRKGLLNSLTPRGPA
jgi:hypothetical protein